MPEFRFLSISNLDDFVYGVSPKPVALQNSLVIGSGTVYPELNFTLPSMVITPETMDEVRASNPYDQRSLHPGGRAVRNRADGRV